MYKKITLAALLGLHLALLANLLFTAWPEMVLWPYLMLHNWKPYQDIAIVHTPILLAELTAFYNIVGVGVTQLKIFTWFYILVTDVLLYWVVKKLFNQTKAVISLAVFITLSLIYQINGMWFDVALIPLAILIYYCLKTKKYLWVGILWAIAFFTKQTAFWFLIPMGIQVLMDTKRDLGKIMLGTVSTSLVIITVLFLMNVLPGFYYWAINFGIFYLPHAPGQVVLPSLRELLAAGFPFAILLPYIFLFKKKIDLALVTWTLFAALGAYPRWELFHLLPAMPFLAILISEVLVFKRNKYVKVLFLLGLAFLLGRFISRNWTRVVRFYEPSVQTLAADIKSLENTKNIYVVNYWDSLYAFSDSFPAIKPWLPTLSWYWNYQDSGAKLVGKLKINPPEVIVVGDIPSADLGLFIDRYYSLEKTEQGIKIYTRN